VVNEISALTKKSGKNAKRPKTGAFLQVIFKTTIKKTIANCIPKNRESPARHVNVPQARQPKPQVVHD
jgi:hypothetical protein